MVLVDIASEHCGVSGYDVDNTPGWLAMGWDLCGYILGRDPGEWRKVR
jgi:hypothetical protein